VVASDPVVSRLVSQLAGDLPRALKAVRSARAAARERAWALAGDTAPGADGALVTFDPDATVVIAHSEKQEAAPTWKKTLGFHPMTAFADHGARRKREPLAIHLRRRVLVRTDSGGGTHGFLDWLTVKSRRLHYSVGMTMTEDMQDVVLKVPADSWTPAYDGDGQVRDGAWVADITGMLDLSSWPAGMRVIVGKERPHPGAQLRFTDVDGHRFTAFAADAKKGLLVSLELRHRRRAAASPNAGPGPARSPPPSPACRPCHPADQPEPSLRHRRSNPGTRGTPPTRRDSRAASHSPDPKITTSRTAQPSTSGTRKIEVKQARVVCVEITGND
jgi:Transposase DDE domain group 1